MYQPKPEKKFEPILGHDVETYYERSRASGSGETEEGRGSGPGGVDGAGSLSNLQRQGCLPPKKKTASFTLTVDPVSAAPHGVAFAIPAGYIDGEAGAAVSSTALRRLPCCDASRCSAGGASRAIDGRSWTVPAHGVRSRTAVGLHALRLPDDPHHRLLLPEPARRDSCRRWCFRWASSCCSARWDWA